MISSNQSGLRPVDSCLNKLRAIKHKKNKSSEGVEVRGFLLGISKAFD